MLLVEIYQLELIKLAWRYANYDRASHTGSVFEESIHAASVRCTHVAWRWKMHCRDNLHFSGDFQKQERLPVLCPLKWTMDDGPAVSLVLGVAE